MAELERQVCLMISAISMLIILTILSILKPLTRRAQATSDTRELEALHAETLHMRTLCLDLEAKCNSDAQVLSSLQREKQLLVMQNSQLLTMQPGQHSMRNSRGSFESKGELGQCERSCCITLPFFCCCLSFFCFESFCSLIPIARSSRSLPDARLTSAFRQPKKIA